MAVFFTADHHFGHKAILRYTKRGELWRSTDEMNRELARRWNEVVSPLDTVYYLGDFSFMSPQDTTNLVHWLNGTKHLICGNHDRKMKAHVRERFESVLPAEHELTVDGQMMVLGHYPMLTWNKAHHGSWNLHGHSHGNLQHLSSTRIDVGVDCHPEYRPFSFEEVKAYMKKRQYQVVDHHGTRHEPDT